MIQRHTVGRKPFFLNVLPIVSVKAMTLLPNGFLRSENPAECLAPMRGAQHT